MFADYAFYVGQGGRLSEEVYMAHVEDAAAEIISQTSGRAVHAPAIMERAVKLCECALVDLIASYRAADSLLPRGVSSINNDGFSVSMSTAGGASRGAREEAKERRAVCQRYLQIPVNLMYRGI